MFHQAKSAKSPYAIVIGLDCFTGLQTARILAGRGIPVIGIASDPQHACCRTKACENVLEQCSLPERRCHNGAPCSQNKDGEWGCDCSIADVMSPFAGKMCRKPITEYCSGKFQPGAALSFCTNGGRCLADFIAAQVAPGDTSVNKKFQ